MADPKSARYFFSAPGKTETGSVLHVLISTGHYGRTIACAQEAEEALRQRLGQADIEFTTYHDNAGEIEIGNTNWDKGVMRVRMMIAIDHEPTEVDRILKQAGFHQGLPACF